MRCPDCNYELKTTHKTCPRCGRLLTSLDIVRETERKKKLSKGTKAFLVCLVLCVAIGLFFYTVANYQRVQMSAAPTPTKGLDPAYPAMVVTSAPYRAGTTIGGTTTWGSSNDRHTDSEAFVCAQAIVESYLKSPSTAKFCKITEATITHSGDKYTVKGWVDAQNSFGTTIRQNFTVTYTATAKGYKDGSASFY